MAIISFSVGTLIFQALIMVFLGEAHSRQLPALAIGMVLAASGVGGALGSVVATRLLPRVCYSWMQIQTWIWVIGFAFLILPAGQQFLLTAIIMAILGLTGALGNIALNTHLMQRADQEMLARVTSVSRLASFAACAIGPIMGGVLVQEFGARRAMFYLFFFTPVLLLLSAFTSPASRLPLRTVGRARRRHGERGMELPGFVVSGGAVEGEPRLAEGQRDGTPPEPPSYKAPTRHGHPANSSIMMAVDWIIDGESSNLSADLS
jgi:MFS family permease